MQRSEIWKTLTYLIQQMQRSSQSTQELVVYYGELESLVNTRVVRASRHLLDNQNIIVLTNLNKTRFLAQIIESVKPKRIIRLFPNINYCPCEYFRIKVLTHAECYTCEHVLALLLIHVLQNYFLHYEILDQRAFNNCMVEPLIITEANFLKRKSMMLTQSECNNYKFYGCLNDIKGLTAGIRSLNFGDHHGYFQISEEGFRCTVEHSKCIQANLFITPLCFTEFHVQGVVHFTIDMNVLTECLNIFMGIDCCIRMFYKENEPLVVIFDPVDEDDITTECSIKTTKHMETIDFCLDENSPTLNIVCVRGPDLLNLFHEFDKSTEELEMTLSPRRPHFKLDSIGVAHSESSIEVAKTSDMIILFNCKAITKASYKSSLIRMTQRAMSVASKVAIKTDASGLLEMHFMMQDTNQAEIYVQFYVTPMLEMEV